MKGGRKPSDWNLFVKKILEEGREKDPEYGFGQALKDASKRKSEMQTSSTTVSLSSTKSTKNKTTTKNKTNTKNKKNGKNGKSGKKGKKSMAGGRTRKNKKH